MRRWPPALGPPVIASLAVALALALVGNAVSALPYSNYYDFESGWQGWSGSGTTGRTAESGCASGYCLYAAGNGSYLQSPNQTKGRHYNAKATIYLGSAGSDTRYVRFYTTDGVQRCSFSTTTNGSQAFTCEDPTLRLATAWYFRLYVTTGIIVRLDNVTLEDVGPIPTPTAQTTPQSTPMSLRVRYDSVEALPIMQGLTRFDTLPAGQLVEATLHFKVTGVVSPPIKLGVFGARPMWVGPYVDWQSFYHHVPTPESWTLWETPGARGPTYDVIEPATYTVTVSATGWYTASVQGLASGWQDYNTGLVLRVVDPAGTQEATISLGADSPYITAGVIP